MKIILLITLVTFGTMYSQEVYELKPGTKGNEITLTVANVSEENTATNVNVILTKRSGALNFKRRNKNN